MKYRTEIDGLRAIAVLAVIVDHTGLGWLPGGFVGVDVFFVISGFLITSIVHNGLADGGFTFRDFYKRRAFRIFPALFCVLTVTTVLGWLLLLPSELKDFSASVFFSVLFLSNGYFIDFVNYFGPKADLIPLLHTWSLAVEEQFYILFPAIAWVSWKLGGKRALIVVVLVMIVLSLALAEWGWRNEPRANYFFSPSRFWEILLGSAAALWLKARARPQSSTLTAIGLVMVFASFLVFDHKTPFPSLFALLPTVGTLLILVCAPDTGPVVGVIRIKGLRWIGWISFSAYLWHQPVFVFARIHNLPTDQIGNAAILIVAVLVLSTLSWKFIEQPFRHGNADGPWIVRRRGIVLTVTAATLIGVSLLGYFTKAPLLRYAAEDRNAVAVTRLDMRFFNREIRKGYEYRAFDANSNAPKVILVGDSFGRDIMNALNYGGLLQQLDFAIWPIAGVCAPFYLKQNDTQVEEARARKVCQQWDYYTSDAMLSRLREADRIILANRWESWHAPYIAETVANLRELTDAPVVLVSPKELGPLSIRDYLKVDAVERHDYRTQAPQFAVDTTIQMQEIEAVRLLNIQELLCPNLKECLVSDDEGYLISLDGGHFTPKGAAFAYEKMARRYDLRSMFGLE